MPEQTSLTMNGHEISHSREALNFSELRQMMGEYGLNGANPQERLQALKGFSKENLAVFMTDLNRRLQGSDDTLISDKMVIVGKDQPTIDPLERYALFSTFVEDIRIARSDINPARVGDALALSTVLLHMFKDGNGRTSRMLSFMFRDEFDSPDCEADFQFLSESRDIQRKKGGNIAYGFIPKVEGDQSNPIDVGNYLHDLLTKEHVEYTGLDGNISPLIRSE